MSLYTANVFSHAVERRVSTAMLVSMLPTQFRQLEHVAGLQYFILTVTYDVFREASMDHDNVLSYAREARPVAIKSGWTWIDDFLDSIPLIAVAYINCLPLSDPVEAETVRFKVLIGVKRIADPAVDRAGGAICLAAMTHLKTSATVEGPFSFGAEDAGVPCLFPKLHPEQCPWFDRNWDDHTYILYWQVSESNGTDSGSPTGRAVWHNPYLDSLRDIFLPYNAMIDIFHVPGMNFALNCSEHLAGPAAAVYSRKPAQWYEQRYLRGLSGVQRFDSYAVINLISFYFRLKGYFLLSGQDLVLLYTGKQKGLMVEAKKLGESAQESFKPVFRMSHFLEHFLLLAISEVANLYASRILITEFMKSCCILLPEVRKTLSGDGAFLLPTLDADGVQFPELSEHLITKEKLIISTSEL